MSNKNIFKFLTIILVIVNICCSNSKKTQCNMDQIKYDFLKGIQEILIDKRCGIWSVDHNLKFEKKVDSCQVSKIINEFNNSVPENRNPKIKFIKIKGPKCYVKVLDSELLTQRLGTAGAELYLALVTFTLTSLPNIYVVNFDFKEGDHAVPGDYTRDDFLAVFE